MSEIRKAFNAGFVAGAKTGFVIVAAMAALASGQPAGVTGTQNEARSGAQQQAIKSPGLNWRKKQNMWVEE